VVKELMASLRKHEKHVFERVSNTRCTTHLQVGVLANSSRCPVTPISLVAVAAGCSLGYCRACGGTRA